MQRHVENGHAAATLLGALAFSLLVGCAEGDQGQPVLLPPAPEAPVEAGADGVAEGAAGGAGSGPSSSTEGRGSGAPGQGGAPEGTGDALALLSVLAGLQAITQTDAAATATEPAPSQVPPGAADASPAASGRTVAVPARVGASPSWTPAAPSDSLAAATPIRTATGFDPTPAPRPLDPTPAPTRPLATVPPTPTPDPFSQAGIPIRFEAPSIGVDTSVESVGLTADNAMDVPKAWANVAWYREGYYPGESGNAVIAGHLDSNTGGPAVFWDLDDLRPGDEVAVTYSNGDRYTFQVQGQQTYPYDAQGSVIQSIFGDSITPDLNLITCDGAWSRGQATYSHRLVVFTTLVPEKTIRVKAD